MVLFNLSLFSLRLSIEVDKFWDLYQLCENELLNSISNILHNVAGLPSSIRLIPPQAVRECLSNHKDCSESC
jgi:hypothetical protein